MPAVLKSCLCCRTGVSAVLALSQRCLHRSSRSWVLAARYDSLFCYSLSVSSSCLQLYHKVSSSQFLPVLATYWTQPCLSCMTCRKRLDSYMLVEHNQEVSAP